MLLSTSLFPWQSPSELDGEGLGKAATAAAREGIQDDAWWTAFAARAKVLAPTLALHDAALVLNSTWATPERIESHSECLA